MSYPSGGFEFLPSAPETMSRFATQAELRPQTPPADAFRVFLAAGMVATFELQRNAADIEETAERFFHGMANMYQILFDDYDGFEDGFEPRDDQVEEIVDAASKLRTSLETEMGFDQEPTDLAALVDVSDNLRTKYLDTLHPGIDSYSLQTRLSAYTDVATDRIGAVSSGHSDHLEAISGDFMGAAAKLIGMDTLSEQAAQIRQEAITVADEFLRNNQQ